MLLVFLVAAATATPVAAAFDWTPVIAIISLVATLLTALGTIVVAIIGKKVKSPADAQSEVEFGVGLLKEQIAKAQRDSDRWLEVEKYLRDELRKSETDRERVLGVLATARDQIEDLTREKAALERRLARLALKVSRGIPILLSDITGDEDEIDEDTEITSIRPAH